MWRSVDSADSGQQQVRRRTTRKSTRSARDAGRAWTSCLQLTVRTALGLRALDFIFEGEPPVNPLYIRHLRAVFFPATSLLTLFFLISGLMQAQQSTQSPATQNISPGHVTDGSRAEHMLRALPLRFEPQADGLGMVSRSGRSDLQIGVGGEVRLTAAAGRRITNRPEDIRLELEGGDPQARPEGMNALPGHTNYFL